MMPSKSAATFSKSKQEKGLNFKRPMILKQNSSYLEKRNAYVNNN